MLGSAFFAAHASFYSGVDWLGAPNAVLTGQAPGGAPVTVVVTLYSPAFSAANASLTYKVRRRACNDEVYRGQVFWGYPSEETLKMGCGRDVRKGLAVTLQACIW